MPTPGMFNPGQISLGSGGPGPFLPTSPMKPPARPQRPIGSQPGGGTVGPETVRATGVGPFDQTYRQNLATYSGGGFQRPGGNLTFDPTAPSGAANSLFGDLGGTGPTDLLSSALGSGGVSFPTAPQPSASAPQKKPNFWNNQFDRGGSLMRPS